MFLLEMPNGQSGVGNTYLSIRAAESDSEGRLTLRNLRALFCTDGSIGVNERVPGY